MVVDFKKLNLKERPTLVLRNMDCVAFGVLGRAFNITADLKFNEVSSISFDYPAIDNGEPVPFYNQIRAMGIIEVKDLGQFILKEAKRTTDGIRDIKSCTAYSLEYELTYKQFFAEKGTYNFWNPAAPKNTFLGMILEKVPYWSLGNVDASLIGKYRTFEAENVNVFEFIKNTVQDTYGCVFTFDTYARKINVSSVESIIPTSQVFLSLDNLIKDIDINEDTENIFTCMEAFGADDLSIRSVNPIGTNKIYNLDYFMTKENVSQAIIDKWSAWKKLFDERQLPYYNLTIEESIQSSRLLTEKSVLTDMKGELKKLEALQATSVQYLGEHPHDAGEQSKLDKVNADIRAQKKVIKTQESKIAAIQPEIDAIATAKAAINKELAFETTFTADEVATLSKYIKESSVQDSSFVVSTVKDYNTADTSSKHENAKFAISGATVTRITNPNDKELYSIAGGSLSCPCGDKALSSNIVRGTLERKNDGNFVFSAYLNTGKIGDAPFPSGNISVTGVAGVVSTDVVPDSDTPDAYETGTRLSFTATSARVYFTQNATEYEARSVQFDLYDYAKLCLDKTSVPAYSFSLNSANFLALDEFILFKNNFTLGQRVYLDIESNDTPNRILQPVVVGISIDFETLSNFSLEFSDKFSSNDAAFAIVDMLKQSISMGKKYSSDQYSTTAFTDSGASSTIENYINGALDVAKQEILASVGQAISWDENGLRLRKWLSDHSGYEPQQIWMNNNAINFTADNWDTVRTALGKITVGDSTLYGLVAEVIIGTLIAGKNLHINTEKEDGKPMTFKVDGAGVRLYNGNIYLSMDGGGKILLDPAHGILLGTKDLFTFDENEQVAVDRDSANMWLDMDGVIHLEGVKAQGDIEGSSIKGSEIYIGGNNTADNCKFGVDKAGNIIGLETLNGKLKFDSEGKAYFGNDVEINGSLTLSGSINWGSNIPNKKRYATSEDAPESEWHPTMQSGDIYCCDWNYSASPQTWGAAYKFVGTDGRPGSDGSDANVDYANIKAALQKAASLPSAFMTVDALGAPSIYGGKIYGAEMFANEFNVFPLDQDGRIDYSGSFNIHGHVIHTGPEDLFHMFRIRYDGGGSGPGGSPFVEIGSPQGAIVKPFNTWDFSDATVEGVTATFA